MIKRSAIACVVRGNNDMSNKCTLAALTLAAASLTFNPVSAMEKAEVKLGELDCRALLKMNGEDEQSTIVFMHGYTNGKAGTTVVNIPSLTEATDKIRDHCINNPSDKLLDVFSKIK